MSGPRALASDPDTTAAHRSAVLYDEECAWCVWALAQLLRLDRHRRLRPVGLHTPEAAGMLRDLSPEERLVSWHLVSPAGERRSAGAALSRLLRELPAGRLPGAALERFPRLAEIAYRLVADHRSQLSRLVSPRARRRAAERIGRLDRAHGA